MLTTTAPTSNAVARNTFTLLGLTLIPTVIGSYLGSMMHMVQFATSNPVMTFLLMLVVLFMSMGLVFLTRDSSLGILFLFIFTFMMGIMLSISIDQVMALKHGARAIMMASLSTAGICLAAAVIAHVSSYDFSKLGNLLMVALIGIIIVSLANTFFFHLSGLALVISFISVGVFTVFLIMDVQKVVNGGETNYIIATLSIYLDVINIFINLLQIFAAFSGGDDD